MRDKVCLFLRGVRVAARVPLSGADPARGSPAYARPAACDARAPCGTQAAEYGAHGVSCARFVSEGMVSVMAALDILAPVLVIVAAIAAVAIAYLAFTALKDRSDRRRDEELMNGYRSKRR